jgi:chemotaxis methyl-accepting protein methylase
LGGSPRDFDVKILATDIDRAALHQARWGSYERDALTGIGPHILFKYFTPGGGRYAVNDRARSMVDFKYHDVTSDVQLSGMDLVICKNLLIYLQKESRERALANLSHAVNPGGFLVLGKTESLDSPAADRFDVVSSRDRVYRKLQPRSPAAHPAPGQQKRGVTL